MSKLITDAQVAEFARLAREAGVSYEEFQLALMNGTVASFTRGLIPGLVLEYPSWIKRHLTPQYEVQIVTDPGEIDVWRDERQLGTSVSIGKECPNGNQIYEELQNRRLLQLSLSFGELKWLDQNQDKIHDACRGKSLYAWGNVAEDDDGYLRVPCFSCYIPKRETCVTWRYLDHKLNEKALAGLRRKT